MSLERPLWRNAYFWAAVVGVIAIPLLRPLTRHVAKPPSITGSLPSYVLVSQEGKPFGSRDLAGKVYVASFFFSRCPSICPKLMREMHGLQQRFERMRVDVRLVSITVDPEHDQPKVLEAYAKRYGADRKRWTFLTAREPDRIRQLIERGFKRHVGQPKRDSAGGKDIVHSGNVAIVDQLGRLRGFYHPDEDGSSEIFHRAISVMLERS